MSGLATPSRPGRALVFIGFMGAGKSSAAREAATALGTRAVDVDKLVEQRLGTTIEEAFATVGEARFREEEERATVETLDRVETPEHLEVLPHGQPVRHVDVGTLEIHLVQHPVALARHLRTEHANAAGGRRHQPHDHRDGGGLSGAVTAKQCRHRARGKAERNAVNRPGILVDLGQPVGADG